MGVYYADADYVGALRRIGVLLIDGVTLFVSASILAAIGLSLDRTSEEILFAVTLAMAWLYVTVLKTSRFRTLGYWLMDCKIVTLSGTKPSPIRLTFRAMLWRVSSSNLLYDLAWCGIDEQKQTLRDRFSGTTLVRNGAKPIGTAPIHLSCCTAMTYAYFYPQVIRPGGLRGEA
ncbi:RDD family protein [Planctomicrobium piriforme]|nr:RDD family protein [Planctomicrobium piriforme]